MTMKTGQLVSICYKPAKLESRPADYYTRISVQEVRLLEAYGIEGDVKGGHPDRQINVMCQETLEALSQNGFNITPGQMGEQLIISGIDISQLQVGDQLLIGETACIEITSHRNGCLRFEHIQGKKTPTIEEKGSLGAMSRVVRGGMIRVGDAVNLRVLETA